MNLLDEATVAFGNFFSDADHQTKVVHDPDFQLTNPYDGFAHTTDVGNRQALSLAANKLQITSEEYAAGLQGKTVEQWMLDNAREQGVENPWSDVQFVSQYNQVMRSVELAHGNMGWNHGSTFSVQGAMGALWGSQAQDAADMGANMPGMDGSGGFSVAAQYADALAGRDAPAPQDEGIDLGGDAQQQQQGDLGFEL